MPPGSNGRGRARKWIRVHEFTPVPTLPETPGRASSVGGKVMASSSPIQNLPPVMLLHGFTGCAGNWEGELLTGLSRGRRVLSVDLPGHGAGAETPEPEWCGVEDVVEGLCSVLTEREILAADWVGYSMGGRIALAAAILHPERVRRLVLESASPGLEDQVERARRKCGDDDLAQAIEDRGIEWFVDYWMGLPLFDSQGRMPPALLQGARARRREGSPEALAGALKGLGVGAQPSYWNALQGVPHPVLLLTGKEDLRYEEIAVRMATALHHCEHRSIAGAGHAPHFEAPAAWLGAVTEFLERNP